jgi:L-glyceraldehyde reductase
MLVAWGVARGYSVIPKVGEQVKVTNDMSARATSSSCFGCPTARIITNFEQVTLEEEDYQKIGQIGKNNHLRFNIPITYSPKWSINLFDEEIEKEARGVRGQVKKDNCVKFVG